MREVVEHVGIGGVGPVVVGTPEKVADDIEAWFEQTDVDGLNVAFATSPGDFEDIADMLVPELTKRGRYKKEYAKGTLREKLFGAGRARLTEAASGGAVPAASGGGSGGVKRDLSAVIASAATSNPSAPRRMRWIASSLSLRAMTSRIDRESIHRIAHHHFDQLRAGAAEGR